MLEGCHEVPKSHLFSRLDKSSSLSRFLHCKCSGPQASRWALLSSLHLVDALSCTGAQYCFQALDTICTVEEDGHFSWPPHCAAVTQSRMALASVSARTRWLAPVQPAVHQEPQGLCCRAAPQSAPASPSAGPLHTSAVLGCCI